MRCDGAARVNRRNALRVLVAGGRQIEVDRLNGVGVGVNSILSGRVSVEQRAQQRLTRRTRRRMSKGRGDELAVVANRHTAGWAVSLCTGRRFHHGVLGYAAAATTQHASML